jgi:N-acetylglutamate synthase-like GNAT family acetyltransferase
MVEELKLATLRTTMTSGINNIIIRKAQVSDLNSIKSLVDQHKKELGFVIRPALQRSTESNEIDIAVDNNSQLIGFVHYRHRKDGQTTLYNIVVDSNWRRLGIASRLVQSLEKECKIKQQGKIFLKCPQELAANTFYTNYGFEEGDTQDGKHRALSIWTLKI